MEEVALEFQRELNSILESKPPVSKAKMNSIVKAAIKSIKHYKHVVYYVENFIKNVKLNILSIFTNKLVKKL